MHKEPTVSEKVALAHAIAERLKGRHGGDRKSDQAGKISHLIEDAGRTKDIAAAKAGLAACLAHQWPAWNGTDAVRVTTDGKFFINDLVFDTRWGLFRKRKKSYVKPNSARVKQPEARLVCAGRCPSEVHPILMSG